MLGPVEIEKLVQKLDTVDLVLTAVSQEMAHPERTIHAVEVMAEVRQTLKRAAQGGRAARIVERLEVARA